MNRREFIRYATVKSAEFGVIIPLLTGLPNTGNLPKTEAEPQIDPRLRGPEVAKYLKAVAACLSKQVPAYPESQPLPLPIEITHNTTHHQDNQGLVIIGNRAFSSALQVRLNEPTQEAKVYAFDPDHPSANIIDTNFPNIGAGHYRWNLNLLERSGQLFAYGNIAVPVTDIMPVSVSSGLYTYEGEWKENYRIPPPSPTGGSISETESALKTADGDWIALCRKESRDTSGSFTTSYELLQIRDVQQINSLDITYHDAPGILSPTITEGDNEILTAFLAPPGFAQRCNLIVKAVSPDLSTESNTIIKAVEAGGLQFSAVEIHPIFNKVKKIYEAVIVGESNGRFALIYARIPLFSTNFNPDKITFDLLTDPKEENPQYPSVATNPDTGETTVVYRDGDTLFLTVSDPLKKTVIPLSGNLLLAPQVAIPNNSPLNQLFITGCSIGTERSIGQIYGWQTEKNKQRLSSFDLSKK